jgi:hypothetical protein
MSNHNGLRQYASPIRRSQLRILNRLNPSD